MEFSRLTGEPIELIESDRLAAASRAALRFSAIVVLKGSRTVVADPFGALAICGAGNPGMATAGSGDVLTGITAALLARRSGAGSTFERAQLAVLLHAMAGDAVAEGQSEIGMVSTDLSRIGLGRVFHRLAQAAPTRLG
jgi:NAD(P)H-hydrate epimerase